MDAIFNIYKPAGITSYGVIRQVKKIAGEKKIGHLGTLDPLAKGVLPLFLGKATKMISYLNQGNKSYQVEAILGFSSTTLDEEGEKTSHPLPENLTLEKIQEALQHFTGEIEQIPPMFSAVHHQGKRLYELAREGVEVERKPRKITIYEITDIELDQSAENPKIRFHVHCSKGTYIRTLVDDLGVRLQTRAYMTDLVRTSCEGGFLLQDAITLDQMENLDHSEVLSKTVDPASILPHWNHFQASDSEVEFLLQGRFIPAPAAAERINSNEQEKQCMVTDQSGKLVALGYLEFSQDSLYFYPEKILGSPLDSRK